MKKVYSTRIVTFLIVVFCSFSKVGYGQFTNLGPVGSATYTTTAGSGSGTGQIHCFGIPTGYDYSFCSNAYKTIFAGSPFGGLWKSTDEGVNWTRKPILVSGVPIEVNAVSDIAFSNLCPNYTLYIATGNHTKYYTRERPII